MNQQVWLQNELDCRLSGTVGKGTVEIGHNVWVGDGAFVLSGVTVGSGAVLAAGAVVTKDVEPFQIVGGNPAKAVRYRFAESVRRDLLAIQWWLWTPGEMRDRRDFFEMSLGPEDVVDLERWKFF